MRRTKLRKSGKVGRPRRRELTRKRREPTRRKRIARPKLPKGSRAQFAPEPTNPATPPRVRSSTVSTAATSKILNCQRQELNRGQRWQQLHEQGRSFAELARMFHCSKRLVRDLVLLGSLPEDLREAYLQGKVGRKKVLKMGRARKKQAVDTVCKATNEQKNPLGNSEPETAVSGRTDAQQTTLFQASDARRGEDPKKMPSQTPPPPISAEAREEEIKKRAALIVDWFALTRLGVCDRAFFFQQVNAALYGGFPWLFDEEAPRQHEPRPIQDPWKFIKRCKVSRGNPQCMPDVLNDAVAWLARSAQRLIPDREMMKKAIARATTRLIHEARTAR